MKSVSPARHVLTLLVVCLAILILRRDAVWSLSVDLAHHYALVARLAEFGVLPHQFDPSLGEMNVYPWFSHAVAAQLGKLMHSNISGMQAVTLGSVLALWAAVGYMFWSLPKRLAVNASAFLIALLIANRFLPGFGLHGLEVVGNYFFAQMAGQALAFAVLCACVYSERAGQSQIVRYALLAVAIPLSAGVHLMPAIELLGVLGLLVLADTVADFLAARRLDVRALGVRAAAVIVGLAGVALHPALKAMREISANNGGIYLPFDPTMTQLMAFCALLMALSLVLLAGWYRTGDAVARRRYAVLKYIALLGATTAVLCGMQKLALAFGMGSPYAVRKYFIGMATFLMLEVALLPVLFARVRTRLQGDRVPAPLALLTAPAVMAAAFFCITPAEKTVSAALLRHYERQIAPLAAQAADAQGRRMVVGDMPDISGVPPYMYTIGLLKAPRDALTFDVLARQPIAELNRVSSVITYQGSPMYGIGKCPSTPVGPLMRVEASCVARARADATLCRGERDFADAAQVAQSDLRGFSTPEPHGRWSDAGQASFQCTMPADGRPAEATLEAIGFVEKGHTQRVRISVNGGKETEVVFTPQQPQQTVRLPLPANAEKLTIAFTLPDAASPVQLGLSADARMLAIGVRRIRFQ